MNLRIPNPEQEPNGPEQMNLDDLQMLQMIDSYSPERRQARCMAELSCGIDPQRLTMFNLGLVTLNGVESEKRAQALL